MLKNCPDVLITPITDIIKISMELVHSLKISKKLMLDHYLEKTSLPKNELKNYKPVSNLRFIFKILEKVVANRLQAHIKNNHLSNPLQSAEKPKRPFYSKYQPNS